MFQLADDGEVDAAEMEAGEAERSAVSMPGCVMEAPETEGGQMSRSVSEATLRRTSLRLNLSPQPPPSAPAVLTSFTPLQQFKKELSVSRRLSAVGGCPRSHR